MLRRILRPLFRRPLGRSVEALGASPRAAAFTPFLVAALLSGCTMESPQPVLTGQDVQLTVIHTADIHSRVFPYQFAPGQIDKTLGLAPTQGDIAIVGGAARMKAQIDAIRHDSSRPRVIHLDSGDIFEGAPVFNTFSGEVEMRAATLLGMNAMALGNHEFDKGAVNLELMINRFGGFPILAANYEFSDPSDPTQPKLRDVISPYTILDAQGVKIAVIGMGNLSSLQGILEGGNSLGIRPLETVSAMKAAVAQVRPFVDLVFVVSHMGLDVDEAAAQTNLNGQGGDVNAQAAIEGVDAIFGGHLHIVLNPPNRIDHAPQTCTAAKTCSVSHDACQADSDCPPPTYTVICHSGAFAKYVGQLDMVVHVGDPNAPVAADRHSHIKSYAYNLHPITDQTVPRGDPEMDNMLEPYQQKMDLFLNLGQDYAVVPCDPTATTCPKVTRTDANGGDSQLGNLVATSMRLRKRVEADFGLTNSLGIRADFESGPLDLEEMYNVFPFDNMITTIFLSGKEIMDTLDFLANKASARGCKSQAQVSGIWYVADCTHGISCGPFDKMGNRATQCLDTKCAAGQQGCMESFGVRQYALDDPQAPDGPVLLGDDCLNRCGNENKCSPSTHTCGKFPSQSCNTDQDCCKCTAVLPFGEYRAAVNDYIAAGGSGFAVFKRNTTKFNTGISLRDGLIDYIRNLPNRCSRADYPTLVGPAITCKADADCKGGFRCVMGMCSTGESCSPKGTDTTGDSMCTKGTRCMPVGTATTPTLCAAPTYDNTGLPCLVPNGIEGTDGRITMVSP